MHEAQAERYFLVRSRASLRRNRARKLHMRRTSSELAALAAQTVANQIGSLPGQVTSVGGDVQVPGIFRVWYDMYAADIADERFVFMVPEESKRTIARRVIRQMEIVAEKAGAIPVLATERMTEERARRLIAGGICFVTPSRHLHMPGIVTALGAFDPPRAPEEIDRPPGVFGAVAQAMVLLHVLGRIPEHQPTLETIGRRLRTAVGAVADAAVELAAVGLCRCDGEVVDFILHGRELFDAAAGRFASPVLRIEHFVGRQPGNLPFAGDAGLCAGTMLAQEDVPTYAVHGEEFPSRAYGAVACDEEDADFHIEHWAYPTNLLGNADVVDPLSLNIVFRENFDDRVSIAADEILEEFFGNSCRDDGCPHP